VADITIFNPDKLAKPPGPLSHIARVKAADLVFIAGQVAVDGTGNVIGAGDFDAQCVQVFANIATALDAVGAGWSNVVQFTSYLVRSSDIAGFISWRGREFPQMFPDGAYSPNTLLIVDRLAQEAFLIEVQAIAAL